MNNERVIDSLAPIDDFVIGTININSLKNKRLAVKNLLLSHNIQILGIVDTELKYAPNFTGYTAINKEKSQFSNGVCILIRNGIAHEKHELPRVFENIDCLAVDILENGEFITIKAHYNHPRNEIPLNFIEYFSTVNKAVLMGDFNARHRRFGDITENRNGIILSNLLLDLPIFRTRNDMPTFLNHIGISIIDHILCTERCTGMMDGVYFIGDTVTSDHMPLLLRTKLRKSIPTGPETKTFRD
ncbi:hypothetical protein JTB14_031614 [Gonioctena quinquepunctata]|nr:hypothetical protein JTB14_031614 [Gonioctena quinquepunctata]